MNFMYSSKINEFIKNRPAPVGKYFSENWLYVDSTYYYNNPTARVERLLWFQIFDVMNLSPLPYFSYYNIVIISYQVLS